MIGRELKLPVEYTWFAQRRGFFRNTLREGRCDAVMAAPEKTERALSTVPYYYSTYVVVTRQDRDLDISSLSDPRLKTLKIGVEVIGDDGTNPPPAEALADRGIIDNVVGYSVYGDYSKPNPPARIIDAVANGDVDVALVWGPRAGYFAGKEKIPLKVVPIVPEANEKLPYAFGISIGVRYGEDEFKEKLNNILAAHHAEIVKILDEYHIPRAPKPEHELDLEVGE
jgi:mxaJ protein